MSSRLARGLADVLARPDARGRFPASRPAPSSRTQRRREDDLAPI